jgi:hypothetical protein
LPILIPTTRSAGIALLPGFPTKYHTILVNVELSKTSAHTQNIIMEIAETFYIKESI